MATVIKPKRGSGAPGSGALAQYEIAIDTTNHKLYYSPDGTTNELLSGDQYSDSDVDTHLNQSTATTDQVLSWTGSDYAWVDDASGISNVVEDTTPQLGGDLDLNGNVITDATGPITLKPQVTATVGDYGSVGILIDSRQDPVVPEDSDLVLLTSDDFIVDAYDDMKFGIGDRVWLVAGARDGAGGDIRMAYADRFRLYKQLASTNRYNPAAGTGDFPDEILRIDSSENFYFYGSGDFSVETDLKTQGDVYSTNGSNLGTSNNRWDTLYVDDINIDGDIAMAGSLIGIGDNVSIDNFGGINCGSINASQGNNLSFQASSPNQFQFQVDSRELALYKQGEIELKTGMRLGNCTTGATDPTSPNEGDLFINTTDSNLKRYNGTTWDNLTHSAGTTVFSTTDNTIVFYNGSGWRKVTDSAL